MEWHDMTMSMTGVRNQISLASFISERLDEYIWKRGPNASEDRILYELNRIDEHLHEARSLNARLRKEINDARRQQS